MAKAPEEILAPAIIWLRSCHPKIVTLGQGREWEWVNEYSRLTPQRIHFYSTPLPIDPAPPPSPPTPKYLLPRKRKENERDENNKKKKKKNELAASIRNAFSKEEGICCFREKRYH